MFAPRIPKAEKAPSSRPIVLRPSSTHAAEKGRGRAGVPLAIRFIAAKPSAKSGGISVPAPHPAGGGKESEARAALARRSSPSGVIQRAPAGKKGGKAVPKATPPAQTYPPFVQADQVAELRRSKGEDWELMIHGHTSEESVGRVLWPTRIPPSVTIALIVAITDPVEIGRFTLSGVRFDSLATMDPSIAALFIAHGLVDESKDSVAVQNGRAAFRARHKDHGEWVLDAMDAALKRVTKRNPALLAAYYKYYADHELTNDEEKDLGYTRHGNTDMNPKVLTLSPGVETSDPLSLLGQTLIHEYVHTPQGGWDNPLEVAPKESKAYAIERFLAERAGDAKRVAHIDARYPSNDPVSIRMGANDVFERTSTIIAALYEVIDNTGSEESRRAQLLSVEFISKNEADYGPELRAFIRQHAP